MWRQHPAERRFTGNLLRTNCRVRMSRGQLHKTTGLIPFLNEEFCVCVMLGKDADRALFPVCHFLMAQSCGRPGHPRLAPDNEHDDDG